MVTGDDVDEASTAEASDASVLKWTDKPLLVYVCADGTCEDAEKFESLTLKNDKVALGTRAFRCLRMTPEEVLEEPVLADAGKTVPRLVFLDPVKMKTKVVETKDLKASKVFKTMKSSAASFWKEKLDGLVKKHLKLLTEQDGIVNAQKTLAGKQARAEEGSAKAKKIDAELAELEQELEDVTKAQVELWKLTAKHKPDTA